MRNQITAGENFTLHLGDNLATLKNYPDNHFDSIVTDPPYFIDFLGKEWDSSKNDFTPLFKECLRVLKPGGYMLAFSAARTYHKLATQVESAGFEIRDQLMWLYSSGFPKAQDIGKAIQKRLGVEETKDYKHNLPRNGGETTTDPYAMCVAETVVTSPLAKEWEGYKTALKPAHEPIVMARKPFKGSTIDNVLKNGLGAMNIDATRVPWADGNEPAPGSGTPEWRTGGPVFVGDGDTKEKKKKSDREGLFRKCGNNAATFKNFSAENVEKEKSDEGGWEPGASGRYPSNVIGEVAEGYQKYFYCPKVSRKERHVGFENVPMFDKPEGDVNGSNGVQVLRKRDPQEFKGNNHPTIKPVALMDYLIKLVTPPSTPELQRKVLDPFTGSGSTGMAATALGHHFTGCELDPKYVDIAKTRIEAWNKTDEAANDAQLPDQFFGT